MNVWFRNFILLALMVAALLLGAYALRLGFISDYLSRSVLIGFTAAISLVDGRAHV